MIRINPTCYIITQLRNTVLYGQMPLWHWFIVWAVVGLIVSALGVALASVHFAASPMTALPSAVGALWHNITGPVVATFFQKWRAADEKKSILDLMEESIAKAREEKTAAV